MDDAEDLYLFELDGVDDYIFANRETTRARSELVCAAAAEVGMLRKQREAAEETIDEGVRSFVACGFGRDVEPDGFEVCFGFGRETDAH